MPSKKRRKRGKKGDDPRRRWSCAAAFARPVGIKIPAHEGFCKANENKFKHARTLAECGGLLIAYAMTAALH